MSEERKKAVELTDDELDGAAGGSLTHPQIHITDSLTHPQNHITNSLTHPEIHISNGIGLEKPLPEDDQG